MSFAYELGFALGQPLEKRAQKRLLRLARAINRPAGLYGEALDQHPLIAPRLKRLLHRSLVHPDPAKGKKIWQRMSDQWEKYTPVRPAAELDAWTRRFADYQRRRHAHAMRTGGRWDVVDALGVQAPFRHPSERGTTPVGSLGDMIYKNIGALQEEYSENPQALMKTLMGKDT